MYVAGLLLFVTLHSWREIHAGPLQLQAREELDDLWMNFKKTFYKAYDDDVVETYR
jgi:hypothetical protein